MPMPMPKPDEKPKDFEDRCMADPMMAKEYPDNGQRFAVCKSQWGKKEKQSAAPAEWLRVRSGGQNLGVDREKDIIRGVILAQEGQFKSEGRGEFDEKALASILKLANEAPNGLKSRFCHPDLSNDGLGKFLGRMRDARLDVIAARESRGELKTNPVRVVRADLHLDPSSHKTPSGDLGGYIMDLAESDPDALSTSLVLQTEKQYRLDDRRRPVLDAEGNELPPLWHPTHLHGSDIVDTGDAVDGMLSTLDTDELPDAVLHRAAELMDRQFAGKDREFVAARCGAWLNRYLDRRYGEPLAPVPAVTPVDEVAPPVTVDALPAYDPAFDPDRRLRTARLRAHRTKDDC